MLFNVSVYLTPKGLLRTCRDVHRLHLWQFKFYPFGVRPYLYLEKESDQCIKVTQP